MKTSSAKHLEDVTHAHILSLRYELTTSSKTFDDLFFGFDRDRVRGQRELTNNKKIKRKYHLRIYLGDFFGFAEHQEKATFELGYKLTLTKYSDNAVLNKNNGTSEGKIKIKSYELYIPQKTPSVTQ